MNLCVKDNENVSWISGVNSIRPPLRGISNSDCRRILVNIVVIDIYHLPAWESTDKPTIISKAHATI